MVINVVLNLKKLIKYLCKRPKPHNLNSQTRTRVEKEIGKKRWVFYLLFVFSRVLMIRKPVMLVSFPLNAMELCSDVGLLVSKCFLSETKQAPLNNLIWWWSIYVSTLPSLSLYKCFYMEQNELTWAQILEQFQSV